MEADNRKGFVTIKIGGKITEEEELVRKLARDIRRLRSDHSLLLLHGGGNEVTRISRELGIEPVFRDGIRITSPEEMDLVEMVLSGKVNKRLVRVFQACGLPAVGLCGADGRIFTGVSLGNGSLTRTGKINRVQPALLENLLENDYFPVISSTSLDEQGKGLNINADSAAIEIACALKSEVLVFISDIPGIMKEGQVIKSLGEGEARAEIESGTITGGMIPKVTSALEAFRRGVGRIVIGRFQGEDSLLEMIQGRRGTRISQDNFKKRG